MIRATAMLHATFQEAKTNLGHDYRVTHAATASPYGPGPFFLPGPFLDGANTGHASPKYFYTK